MDGVTVLYCVEKEMTIGIMHFLSISVILFISSNLMMDIWEKAKITKSIERARQVLIA